MTEQEQIEILNKRKVIWDLLDEVRDKIGILFMRFYDYDSDEMLDEKIEVFTQLKNGKSIEEIPNYYDVFELYPKGNVDEDGNKIAVKVLW